MGFEVLKLEAAPTGYFCRIRFKRLSHPYAHYEEKIFTDRDAACLFIDERTCDYIYFQLHDLIAELKYHSHDNDERARTILDQLQADLKYLLTLPHLQRCRFIQEHMIIMLESVVPIEDGYARHHLTWYINELKITVGFEVTWKSAA